MELWQGNARELPYPDGAFDLVYNGYMFDLIPLDGFLPILAEMVRVLKPGGKLVLVNMIKPDERKTFYEKIYERGWAIMPCRPVLMSPYLAAAGFTDIRRYYRPTRGSLIARLWHKKRPIRNDHFWLEIRQHPLLGSRSTVRMDILRFLETQSTLESRIERLTPDAEKFAS